MSSLLRPRMVGMRLSNWEYGRLLVMARETCGGNISAAARACVLVALRYPDELRKVMTP